jgi:hypothetical protein
MRRRAQTGLYVAVVVLLCSLVWLVASRSKRAATSTADEEGRDAPGRFSMPAAPRSSERAGELRVPEGQDWLVRGGTIEVAGRVYRDGVPFAGTLTVSDEMASGGLFPSRRVTAGEDGRFVFAGLPRIRGFYRVTAQARDRAPAWASAPGDVSTRDLELRLDGCKLHVYGTVADASGARSLARVSSWRRSPITAS